MSGSGGTGTHSRVDSLVLGPLRDAARSLRHSRGYTLTAVLSVAGATCLVASVYAVVAATVLSAPPYPEPDALVELWQTAGPGSTQPQDYLAPVRMEGWVRDPAFRTLQGVAATGMGPTLVLRTDEGGVRVGTAPVLGDWFGTLGVAALRGRALTPQDLRSGAPPAAVVSEPFWRTHLGAGPLTTLHLSGTPFTVVGVMPRSFDPSEVVWIPVSSLPEELRPVAYAGIARLGPGASVGDAAAEVEHLAAAQVREDSARYAGLGATARTLGRQARSADRPALWMLAGVVLAVVLVALNNLTVLTLVRAQLRSTSLAVRAALGANRWDLGRSLAAEGVLIGLAGALLGLGLAYWGKDAAAAYLARDPAPPALTPGVAGVALGLGMLVALVIGLEPVRRIRDPDLAEVLQGRSGGAGSTPGERRGRQVLVAAQVATCVALLAVAGVLTSAHAAFRSLDVGYDARRVLEVFPDWEIAASSDREQWRIAQRVTDRLKDVPEVAWATAWRQIGEDYPPRPEYDLVTDGPALGGGGTDKAYRYYEVLPDFVATLGLELVRGRAFTPDDGTGASSVAIVTARAARIWWPGVDALGRQIKLGRDGAWMTVVGVVQDLQQLDELGRSVAIRSAPPAPLVFLPYGQLQGTPPGWRSFDCCAGVRIGARVVDDPATVIRTARAIVAQEAPGLPLVSAATLYDVQTRGYVGSSMATTGRLVSLGMLVALLLALVGIVGVGTETVGRRHREIGVRMALGAGRGRVLWSVGKESVVTTLAGLVAGMGALVALEAWLSRVVFDYYVRQLAPEVLSAPVLGTASAVVLVTALVAVLATARRATRVNPSEVLRSE